MIVCRNPKCITKDPVLTWGDPEYCSDNCRRVHAGQRRECQPIVTPGGVISTEIVEAVTERIQQRRLADEIAAGLATPPQISGVTAEEAAARLAQIVQAYGHPAPTESLKLTPWEWKVMQAYRSAPNPYGLGGEIGSLIGTPVEIVEPDQSQPGWLSRLMRRLFG